jgi:XTP/dITP diphosphohydrolase
MNQRRPTELLIGTRNAGKLLEFQSLLADLPVELRSLNDFPAATEIEESGRTFEDNALLKAKGYAKQTRLWTLADDSGLEVDALGGAPGVFSARYGGVSATDAARINRLLNELSRTDEKERRARFVCVIAITDSTAGQFKTFTGTCEGRIARAPRGTHGFGYDPVFIPDGYMETFGELPAAIKQQISHRARALKAARAFLLDYYQKP